MLNATLPDSNTSLDCAQPLIIATIEPRRGARPGGRMPGAGTLAVENHCMGDSQGEEGDGSATPAPERVSCQGEAAPAAWKFPNSFLGDGWHACLVLATGWFVSAAGGQDESPYLRYCLFFCGQRYETRRADSLKLVGRQTMVLPWQGTTMDGGGDDRHRLDYH